MTATPMLQIDRLSGEVDTILLAQISLGALEPRLTSTQVPVYDSGRTAFMPICQRFADAR